MHLCDINVNNIIFLIGLLLDDQNLEKGLYKHLQTCYNHLHKLIIIIIMTPEAERFNGWAAMLGFVAAVGAYVTTGQIIPGWL